MGLLNKESKEEKQERKVQELMQKYGLDKLDTEYVNAVKNINSELMGTRLMETGLALSMVSAQDQLKISYLNSIMQQNWIIIRLLNDIKNK